MSAQSKPVGATAGPAALVVTTNDDSKPPAMSCPRLCITHHLTQPIRLGAESKPAWAAQCPGYFTLPGDYHGEPPAISSPVLLVTHPPWNKQPQAKQQPASLGGSRSALSISCAAW
jgi:hypothetical protein